MGEGQQAFCAADPVNEGQLLRETHGRCGTCLKEVPAALHGRDGKVFLDRYCPEHGRSTQLISQQLSDWAELDQYYFKVNADNRPQRDFIVRMTERCNLACPICLAKANTEDTPDLDLRGLEKLLSERRGIKIDLMAAEPTLRPDLEDWVRKVKQTGNIAALHTNGLKLAHPDYCHRMKEAGVDEVFLQFDGLDDHANRTLRGRPLLKARLAALQNLRTENIATSLIVVIGKDINEAQVSETLHFALRPENDHIREVFFLGLRNLGSARHNNNLTQQSMMPDEILDLLCQQVPRIHRRAVVDFNKFYFAMLSALQVKKCLYVQHYLVLRDGNGGFVPIEEILDLPALNQAAEHYATRYPQHPTLARTALAADIIKAGFHRNALKYSVDFLALEQLLQTGMNLDRVPRRMLLLGFITACDPDNFDSAVAINCGKGELSTDGGFIESGAIANVEREARFAVQNKPPGPPRHDTM